MSTISIHRPEFLRFYFDGSRNHGRFRRTSTSVPMATNSNSSETRKEEEISVQLPTTLPPQICQSPSLFRDDLQFNRLQQSDQELIDKNQLQFGKFVAREAVLDEEYWTAAWLRAESHWEDRPNERYADTFKRKYAEQEFNAIKRRCKGQPGQTSSCIVAVKKENKNVKRIVLKSIVGTLDLSIRYLLNGETFPGERVKGHHLFCTINRTSQNRYGYIANLCVAKSARCQGIAKNMLNFAVESAKSSGAEEVYVHVHRNNGPAHRLYKTIGFEVNPRRISSSLFPLAFPLT